MKELIEKINAEYEVFAANAAAQAEKGNKAAGTRARKSALEISKLRKEFRKVSVEAAKYSVQTLQPNRGRSPLGNCPL